MSLGSRPDCTGISQPIAQGAARNVLEDLDAERDTSPDSPKSVTPYDNKYQLKPQHAPFGQTQVIIDTNYSHI